MTEYRVLVTGSRDWIFSDDVDYDLHREFNVLAPKDAEKVLVHGDCPRGADRMAREWAAKNEVKEERHPADWNTLGKRAGFVRNAEMVNLGADVVYAYIRNNSRGATHTATLARDAGIPVVIRRYDD